MISRFLRWLFCLGLLLSAGCASLEPFLASLATPSPVPTPSARVTSTPAPLPTETAIAEPEALRLRLWLPEEFNPAGENHQAEILTQRLAEFQSLHPDLELEVRLKKAEGEAGLLNALAVTSKAAPGALPDLVLLSRSDLEVAAGMGLLHPIDGLSTALDDPNWYGYAQQLAHIQNTGYGLPFVGDALILVYYPELGQIVTWEDILASDGQIVFPAGNPQGLVALSLYASTGVDILDAQGLPTLDQDALTSVLNLVKDGLSKDIFPASLSNITNEPQALQIYRTGSANKAIIWFISHHPDSDGTIMPLPGLNEASFAYATGWIWALAGAGAENQQLAAELAEFLVDKDFLADWTRATGYLPTRPSIVDEGDRTLTAILESAHPIPSGDALAILGPLMQEALTRVLNGEEPEDVAGSIIEKLQ